MILFPFPAYAMTESFFFNQIEEVWKAALVVSRNFVITPFSYFISTLDAKSNDVPAM